MNVRSAWLCIDTKDKQQLPKVKYRMWLLIFAHKIVIRVFSHQYGVYRIDMFIERPIEYNLISTPVWTERKSPFVACDNFPIVIFRLPNIRNNVARIITSILKVGEIAAVGARTKNRYGPLFVDTFSLRTGVSECLYVCESWQLMKVSPPTVCKHSVINNFGSRQMKPIQRNERCHFGYFIEWTIWENNITTLFFSPSVKQFRQTSLGEKKREEHGLHFKKSIWKSSGHWTHSRNERQNVCNGIQRTHFNVCFALWFISVHADVFPPYRHGWYWIARSLPKYQIHLRK